MDCESAEEALASLLDTNSDGTHTQELLIHFRNCKACRDLIANLFLVKVMTRIAREHWGTQKTGQVSET